MKRFREPVSGFSHLCGALLTIVGLGWLLSITQDDTPKQITMMIYGVSLFLMFSASAALHLYNGSPENRHRLRRLDHASIYVAIAGHYTPLIYHLLPDHWRWWMLILVWILAVVGVVYKLLYLKGSSHFSTPAYVAMGWLALFIAPLWVPQLPLFGICLLFGGGIAYTIGAYIFATEKPNLHKHFGFHELWHMLVLLGSVLHFTVLVKYIAPG